MAVTKEWRCAAHGTFESTKPRCPYGCNTVTRTYLTPPSIVTSGRTASIDRSLETLAAQHNLTDLSNRNGSIAKSVQMYDPKGLQAGFAPLGKNPMDTMKTAGFEGDNAIDRVRSNGNFLPPVPAAGSIGDKRSVNALKVGK